MKAIFLSLSILCLGAQAPTKAPPATAAHRKPPMLSPAAYKAKAPETYRAKFTTSKGDFVVEVTRAWAPLGADRFYNLVKGGYFDGAPLYRVISNFMVQFGFSPNPAVSKAWDKATIKDDPVKQSNKRGYITFATAGPNTRTTQVFINYGDNSRLDRDGFTPFGTVVEGMDVVDNFYKGYGDGADMGGRGPTQGKLAEQGIAYVKKSFPNMDTITSAEIVTK
jgi:peptidyl-prolyl cis-trans isomerase A (cyclophilin A)